jgi:hypothetical protein
MKIRPPVSEVHKKKKAGFETHLVDPYDIQTQLGH